jgi:hypothetical protein
VDILFNLVCRPVYEPPFLIWKKCLHKPTFADPNPDRILISMGVKNKKKHISNTGLNVVQFKHFIKRNIR